MDSVSTRRSSVFYLIIRCESLRVDGLGAVELARRPHTMAPSFGKPQMKQWNRFLSPTFASYSRTWTMGLIVPRNNGWGRRYGRPSPTTPGDAPMLVSEGHGLPPGDVRDPPVLRSRTRGPQACRTFSGGPRGGLHYYYYYYYYVCVGVSTMHGTQLLQIKRWFSPLFPKYIQSEVTVSLCWFLQQSVCNQPC